jgi:hypothetical protein
MAPMTRERRYNSFPLTGDGVGDGLLLVVLLIVIVSLIVR